MLPSGRCVSPSVLLFDTKEKVFTSLLPSYCSLWITFSVFLSILLFLCNFFLYFPSGLFTYLYIAFHSPIVIPYFFSILSIYMTIFFYFISLSVYHFSLVHLFMLIFFHSFLMSSLVPIFLSPIFHLHLIFLKFLLFFSYNDLLCSYLHVSFSFISSFSFPS